MSDRPTARTSDRPGDKTTAEDATGTHLNRESRHSSQEEDRVGLDLPRPENPSPNSAFQRDISNSPKADGADVDVFSQAVDVARSAKIALDQAKQASERARYIEQLATRAQAEANALHEVSTGLAATATSVAMVALEVCRHSNMEHAFTSNPSNATKMSFEAFRDVIQTGSESRQTRPRLPSPRPVKTASGHPSCLPKSRAPEDLGPVVVPGTNTRETIGVGILKDVDRPKASRHSRRLSCPPLSDTSSHYSSDQENESKLPKERFPSPLNADVYKDSLAASFDSKSGIAPLWEDRYCDPATTSGQRSNPQQSTERWKEKKAMRQFQIKLQKLGMESESSGEIVTDQSCDADVISDQSRREGRPCGTRHTQEDRLSRLRRVSSSDSENDFSTDSEIEEILLDVKTPKPLRKLRALEQRQVRGRHLVPSLNTKVRAVSPLLSNSEKDFYTVSGDESCPSPTSQKHVFVRSGSERPLANNERSRLEALVDRDGEGNNNNTNNNNNNVRCFES